MVSHIQSSPISPLSFTTIFYKQCLSNAFVATDHFCFFFYSCFFYINILFALLNLKSYQFTRKDMYVAFQCSSLFLLPSSTPSASRRILQKVRLPPLVSSRPSSFRYSSRILPSLFSCRHMSKFLRRSCFRIEGF